MSLPARFASSRAGGAEETKVRVLTRGAHEGVLIRPRWPARRVAVDADVLDRLRAVQAQLPATIELVLTRGFEPRSSTLGFARDGFRAVGVAMFRLLYPARRDEIADIFGANGHDVDGTHVDVSLRLDGRRMRMLPLGVFTPPGWQRRRAGRCGPALELVRAALAAHGFRIHSNPTESLQIHCDLIR
jgi:hypothetical protein